MERQSGAEDAAVGLGPNANNLTAPINHINVWHTL